MKSLVKSYMACLYQTCPVRKVELFVAVFRGHEGKGTWLLKASVNHVQELIFISSIVSFIEHWGRRYTELARTISLLCGPHRLLEESLSVLCLLPYKNVRLSLPELEILTSGTPFDFFCAASLRLQYGPLSFIREILKYSSFFYLSINCFVVGVPICWTTIYKSWENFIIL